MHFHSKQVHQKSQLHWNPSQNLRYECQKIQLVCCSNWWCLIGGLQCQNRWGVVQMQIRSKQNWGIHPRLEMKWCQGYPNQLHCCSELHPPDQTLDVKLLHFLVSYFWVAMVDQHLISKAFQTKPPLDRPNSKDRPNPMLLRQRCQTVQLMGSAQLANCQSHKTKQLKSEWGDRCTDLEIWMEKVDTNKAKFVCGSVLQAHAWWRWNWNFDQVYSIVDHDKFDDAVLSSTQQKPNNEYCSTHKAHKAKTQMIRLLFVSLDSRRPRRHRA